MTGFSETNTSLVVSCNSKINSLEKCLQKSVEDFKELKTVFEKICIDSQSYKSQFLKQKEKCDSRTCCSGEHLNKIIESKNRIILLIASNLKKLNETKNFAIVEETLKALGKETGIDISPTNIENDKIKIEKQSQNEANESISEEISFNDSENEIVGTPTGRISPIIQSKKIRSKANDNYSDNREKKKCPENWSTPEKKTLKLIYPTSSKNKGGGKVRQMRLTYSKVKQTSVVDLTCSPEFSGGVRCLRSPSLGKIEPTLIKKESIENEDTIMPSPTSGATTFSLFKPTTTETHIKNKKTVSLKIKKEKENDSKLELHPIKKELKNEDSKYRANSVNISHQVPDKIINDLKRCSPVKGNHLAPNDTTYCDNSLSILHQNSPSKRPLVENVNTVNVKVKDDMESSMSLLKPESKVNRIADADDVKRKIYNEPIFKEPTVRKRSEKRALPGWICEQCKNFYGALYEDNPLMLEKMIEECSKHRGRWNPARPKTPPNFWNPRWDVPEDTEELNRMNNAI